MRRILITLAALALAALAVPAAASAHHGHRAGDRNRDGLPDRWERQHHLSLRFNQAHRDPDHDGVNNRREFEHGTDPRNRDTDHNGVGDRNEINPVGTIASFNAQNGALTITLANGQSVTGQVTPATRIECRENENEVENEVENEHPNGDNFAVRDGGDDRGGDNSGPGSGGGGDNSGPGSGGGDTTTPPTTTAPQQPNTSGPGSDNSGPGSGDQGEQQPGQPGQPGDRENENCGTAGLVPRTPVREAEARLTGNGLVFEEIELGQLQQ